MILQRIVIRNFATSFRRCNSEKIKELLNNAAIGEEHKNEEWSTMPYPNGAVYRDQSRKSKRSRKDPKETSIILFPGQGEAFIQIVTKRHVKK